PQTEHQEHLMSPMRRPRPVPGYSRLAMEIANTPASHRRRPSPYGGNPASNSILAGLLATEYKRLLPKLEYVLLKRGEIVYRADQRIEAVYFPEDAVIAMIDSMDDGRTVEV